MASVDDVRKYWDRRPCNSHHALLPSSDAGKWEWWDYSMGVSERKYRVEPHIYPFMELARAHNK